MKIGNVKLDTPLILAPMAAVNCAAFRLLCREAGAGMVSTPMLVVNQVVEAPEKIIERTCFLKDEKPISVQLSGSNSEEAEEATRILDQYADVFDINFGCPEKDMLKINAGAYFSRHPDQMHKMVTPIINNTNRPVTAKIRLGWDSKSIQTLKIVKILEDLGVDAIAIHARTKEQKYSGKADWSEIKKAKEKANIPIIGNGDVFKSGTSKVMLDQTGCDAVMIGRGTIGNPLIFKRCKALLETGKNIPEMTEEEKVAQFMKFLDYYKKYENLRSFTELRQQSMWFTKGTKGARDSRLKLMKAQSVDEILEIYKKK